MHHEPSTFQFSLRAMFIYTTLVALGLLGLMYTAPWVVLLLWIVVVLLFSYAIVAVLASSGNRRLFWAAFATTAVALRFSVNETPNLVKDWLWGVLFPDTPAYVSHFPSYDDVCDFARLLFVLAVSTTAAHIIPWLVQRGQEPPHE